MLRDYDRKLLIGAVQSVFLHPTTLVEGGDSISMEDVEEEFADKEKLSKFMREKGVEIMRKGMRKYPQIKPWIRGNVLDAIKRLNNS